MRNLFFRQDQLGSCGNNVVIGRTVRIRYPEFVHLGDNCIIDDYTYISTGLVMDGYGHIAAGCKLIGGKACTVRLGQFSTFAPNVVISAGTDDYRGGIATPFVPSELKREAQYSDIIFGRHCIVGANSVVLPFAEFGEGAALGALSLAKGKLSPWSLYAGIPARKIADRDKRYTLAATKKFKLRQAI